jgi:hypothetical protein
MPETQYIKLRLRGEELSLPQTEDLPVSITYEMEDEDDFRQKNAGTALNITVPATTQNSSILNSLFNPHSEDMLPDEGYDKPLDVVLIGAGNELMKGKAFVLGGKEQNGKPISFDINCFGDNADWVIPNKELTLHDVVSEQTHYFTKDVIEDSWAFDGWNEGDEYVYAPVRYREPFGETGDVPDTILRPMNMRPALFLYWLLYRGFKVAGYKIRSDFFETDYFRRMTLPWTWGNFLYVSESQLKEMGFLATGPLSTAVTYPVTGDAWSWEFVSLSGAGSSVVVDTAHFVAASAEHNFKLDNVTTDIGYIGNILSYSYNNPTGTMAWEYLNTWAALGVITVALEVKLTASIDVSFLSEAWIDYEVFINGSLVQTIPKIFFAGASALGTDTDWGTRTKLIVVPNVNPNDIVSVRIKYHCKETGLGFCFVKIWATGDDVRLDPTNGSTTEKVRSYIKLAYIKRQMGSVIQFKDYDRLKNYKWLDLLRGVIDAFNLQPNTDSVSKTVTIEPTHTASLGSDLSSQDVLGYYNGNSLEWSGKRDLVKVSEVNIFQDYEREVIMKLKDDGNDGILKLIQDRHNVNVTSSKYVFPERFKKGNKEIENRFFSGVMHFNHLDWTKYTGVSPQLIVLFPENINSTSNPESESTMLPKLAYYKGVVDRNSYGGWNWDGDINTDLPYMFAVNYHEGGESDPVLTYGDQRVSDGSGGFIRAYGLFKRFFWQRFAIMRHGKKYSASFNLNNTDVLNWLHREYKSVDGNRYQLIKIDGYKPLINETTLCVLWRWYPVTDADADNTYPSYDSVVDADPIADSPDFKYQECKCMNVDIRF